MKLINIKVLFFITLQLINLNGSNSQQNLKNMLRNIQTDNLMLPLINKEITNEKTVTIMVYIAADNNLHIFVEANIEQLKRISPPNANILVHLSEPGRNKKTKVYLIRKGLSLLLNSNNNKKLDSGNPNTLVDFCKNGILNFPAQNYILVLWNHGTGVLDPIKGKGYNPSELFMFNPEKTHAEQNNTIEFLQNSKWHSDQRGICFDDTHNTYLTNEKLIYAFDRIKKEALNGKKFAIIGMDACLMSMLEVANIFKDYSEIMVSSQEVELGAGWRYDLALAEIANATKNFDKNNVAKGIVSAYKKTYENIYDYSNYTLSAINLNKINKLETEIHNLATSLIQLLKSNQSSQIRKTLTRATRFNFDWPGYVDLYSFCESIAENIEKIETSTEFNATKNKIKQQAQNCLKTIKETIIANESGRDKKYAKGISIYLPTEGLHPSYRQIPFSKSNNWYKFLIKFLYSK